MLHVWNIYLRFSIQRSDMYHGHFSGAHPPGCHLLEDPRHGVGLPLDSHECNLQETITSPTSHGKFGKSSIQKRLGYVNSYRRVNILIQSMEQLPEVQLDLKCWERVVVNLPPMKFPIFLSGFDSMIALIQDPSHPHAFGWVDRWVSHLGH